MEITKEQAETRLNSPNNLANRFSTKEADISIIPIQRPGAKFYKPRLTEEAKVEIAVRSRSGEQQKTIAADFDITQANVSQIERGNTKVDEPAVKSALERIEDKALERLLSTLNLLDDDKLSGCNAKDLSSIGANMSKIVSITKPKDDGVNRPHVIIYAPEMRREQSYKMVEIG